jgi:transglutaminase-like putative cysteine protease
LERFPPEFFLRNTALTAANAKMQAYCAQMIELEAEPLGCLHKLMSALHRDLAWKEEPASDPTAVAAGAVFAHGAGDAAGLTHVFIACAHQLAIPARFAYGWCLAEGTESSRLRSWAEAHVPGLGWVAFDPVLGHCPSEMHVRVAIGLDALGAFPIRLIAAGVEHTNRSDRTELERELG